MSKANQKDRAAALADLAADFQTEPPRGYPQAVPTQPAPEPAPIIATRLAAPRVEAPAHTQHAEKRRPGRPKKEGARMVPFASRLSETDKEGLAELAHRHSKSETALLGEAMALLFDRYQR
jgi:hypothetical protein